MPRIPRSVSNIPVPIDEGGTNAATSAAAALSLNIEVGKIDMAVSGKTLTITCSTPCTRFIPNSTSGINTLIDISGKSWSFNFDTSYNAASCGITPTVSWTSPMPWFVYLLNGTDAAAGIQAMVSRNPCMTVSPAEGLFHYSDAAADTNTQLSVIVPYADGTDYSAKPVLPIGSYRMTYDTTDDDWTPSALSNTDGYGKFQEGVVFTFPVGQNGAQAGHYTTTDGPTWANAAGYVYVYTIDKNGCISVSHSTFGAGNVTNGGAGVLYLTVPLAINTNNLYNFGVDSTRLNNTLGQASPILGTASTVSLRLCTASSSISNNAFVNAADDLSVRFQYKAF